MAGGSPVGFQWEKYEAWRAHPLLKFNWRNTLPGVHYGLAAFAAYVLYDKMIADHSKDGHHGHH